MHPDVPNHHRSVRGHDSGDEGGRLCDCEQHPSVVSPAIELFGEVDATQQALEASVGTKWVESRIHLHVA
jgi:hypothetical protein